MQQQEAPIVTGAASATSVRDVASTAQPASENSHTLISVFKYLELSIAASYEPLGGEEEDGLPGLERLKLGRCFDEPMTDGVLPDSL